MKKLKILIVIALCTTSVSAQDTIYAKQAQAYMGKKVVVCDRVNYGKHLNINKNGPTILYVGPDHPNHYLNLYFPKSVLRRFSFDPEKKMINKTFCATGRIESFENKPTLYIRRESQVNEEEVNSYIYDFDEKQKN